MHLHFFAKNNKNNLYNVYVSAILLEERIRTRVLQSVAKKDILWYNIK